MKKRPLVLMFFIFSFLCSLMITKTTEAYAKRLMAPRHLALYYDEHRVQTDPNEYKSAIVELTLGDDIVLRGEIEPPPLKTLNESELYYLADEARQELGLSISEIGDIESWPYFLDDRVKLELVFKFAKIGANYIPGPGGEAVSAGMTVYNGYKSVERGKGYSDVASDAASLVAGHEFEKMGKNTALKFAKLPGYGQVVLGTVGALKEAADTTQYEDFCRDSDKKFRKAAEYHVLLNRKIQKALEEKNKKHSAAYIYFEDAECIVENKSLLGVSGIKMRYRLVGTLYQETKSNQEFSDLSDMSGKYKGTLYLTVEGVDLADSLDAGWADRTDLCEGAAAGKDSVDEWCQVLKRFPNQNFIDYRKTTFSIFTEKTVKPASLVRKLSGDFTAEISSKDGLGKVVLGGSFDNNSDETLFEFHHQLYMISRLDVVRDTGKKVINYGPWEETVNIMEDPDGSLNGLYIMSTGNEATEKNGDAAYIMFSGGGRLCMIPKSKKATVFDDLRYPPKMTIKAKE